MIGLNKDILCQYVEYITNQRIAAQALSRFLHKRATPCLGLTLGSIAIMCRLRLRKPEISSYLVGAIDSGNQHRRFRRFFSLMAKPKNGMEFISMPIPMHRFSFGSTVARFGRYRTTASGAVLPVKTPNSPAPARKSGTCGHGGSSLSHWSLTMAQCAIFNMHKICWVLVGTGCANALSMS